MQTDASSIKDMIGRSLKRIAIVICAFGFLAIAWRFADNYERQVMNDSVRARIEVERHEFWKKRMASSEQEMNKDEAVKSVGERAAAIPHDLTPALHEPGAP